MTAKILEGNVLETLKDLPACSVQCVVTSPPYYVFWQAVRKVTPFLIRSMVQALRAKSRSNTIGVTSDVNSIPIMSNSQSVGCPKSSHSSLSITNQES